MKRILIFIAGALVGAACLLYFMKKDSVTSFAEVIAQNTPPAATEPLQDAVLPPNPAQFSVDEPGPTDVIVAEPDCVNDLPVTGVPATDAPPAQTGLEPIATAAPPSAESLAADVASAVEPVASTTTEPAPAAAEIEAPLPTTPQAPPAETPAEKSIAPDPVAPEPIVAAPEVEESAVPATVADSFQAHAGALVIPVTGIAPNELLDTFNDKRGTERIHEAIDIMAPIKTPVVAVDDGKVVKLFNSVRGGLTVYQFDPAGKLAYYYAHLDSYAPGVIEGKDLKRGDLVGYVGVTGNSNPQAPHLHFAVFELGPEKRWWKGTAINPYPLFKR